MNKFSMANEVEMVQFTKHFNNLVSYFHFNNYGVRAKVDKIYCHKTSDILASFYMFLENPLRVTELLNMPNIRANEPMHFRVAQLVQHYGPILTQNFIAMTFQKAG